MYVTFDLNLLQIQFVDLQSPKILIGHDHIQLNQGAKDNKTISPLFATVCSKSCSVLK